MILVSQNVSLEGQSAYAYNERLSDRWECGNSLLG